jgi:hypothetical protein
MTAVAATKRATCQHERQVAQKGGGAELLGRMASLDLLAAAASKLSHATLTESQDKVMLCMAAHVPAKRADLGALRIVSEMPSMMQEGNYIVLPPESSDSATLVMDHYMLQRLYGRHVERLPIQVAQVMHESIARWPRSYVFCVKIGRKKGCPLNNAAYSKRFHEVLLRRTGCDTNIQIARKAFIKEKVGAAECTVAYAEATARNMMHSMFQQRACVSSLRELQCHRASELWAGSGARACVGSSVT